MADRSPGFLVLLRHGESEWNARNLFTGWVDVGLSEHGWAEARRAGELLGESGLLPDVVHTSVLRRAISTTYAALEACDRLWVPVRRSWRLNERHYGALQGRDKTAIREAYGDEQFAQWRRSYRVPPPPLEPGSELSAADDPRYSELPPEAVPATECLADVLARVLPYWYDAIVPELRTGRNVLVSAHGNSLRALVKHLDQIGDEEIAALNIPTGIPLQYQLDDRMRPVQPGGRYLDAEQAAAAIEAVRGQGG
jgi:2,3-bisphosphoglycerate-dependent phosphoglycerate mutase